MKKLFKGAVIVSEESEYVADILVEGGTISSIGRNLNCGDCEIVDLSGKYIMPGAIDVHTHFSLDLGKFVAVDDFYDGTVAAAAGGTTAIVDHMGFGPKNCSLYVPVETYHGLADDKAIIDYAFHGVLDHVNSDRLKELKDLTLKEGVTSFKVYMTYGGMLDDESLIAVLKAAAECGATIAVHAENHGSIEFLRKEAAEKGHIAEPIYHSLTRPNQSEAEAVNRMIYLAKMAGEPRLYFVHISAKESVEEIRLARRRGQKHISMETCTQYLLLDRTKLEPKKEGLKYICSPPLRGKEDIDVLWSAVADGTLDVIATDHCPFFYERDKLQGYEDFRKAPGGIPGVEERVELILTEGAKRGIPMKRLVELLSTNPAIHYGIENKGKITVGYDADFCVFEKKPYIIKSENRHSACDYTCYEDYKTDFTVVMTVSRGDVIMKNKKITAEKGRGNWMKRKISDV